MSTVQETRQSEFSVVEPSPAIPEPRVSAPLADSDDSSSANPTSIALPERVHSPKNWMDRIEAFISRLSVRDHFWHRICSLIWLPYAYFSGIRTKQIDPQTFQAILPFSRFNRNWYRAMAGAALLGNSEIAGGMYVFGVCGAAYTVVCKHLEYKFLRPCLGPAVYKIKPRENVVELVKKGVEFNLTLDMDISQQVSKPGDKDRRVGRCVITFHATPKQQHKKNYDRLGKKA